MRNRHRLPIDILLTFLLSTLVLLGSSTASAQESARDRVTTLRGHLAQVEGTYAESLVETPANQTATIKVDCLRADLRTKLEKLFNRSTSSEAALAVYRADAESTLDAIRVYEQVLGVGGGEETTFMNVLSDAELRTIRDLVHSRGVVLKQERFSTPPKDLSSSLEFRIRELEGWEQSLDLEIARRKNFGPAQLKTIPADITAENARVKYPSISKADGPGSEPNFQKRLALQVNSRLHTAPEDASLTFLRDGLPEIKPPVMSSPLARGPPHSVEEALNRLASAQLEELNAVTRRDAIGIAGARAKLTATREWLRLNAADEQVINGLGFSKTSTGDLIHLRKAWQQWLLKLNVEQQSGTSSAAVAFEINEARSRINELDARIERRLIIPPPEGGDLSTSTSGTDPPSPPATPEARALNRDWDRRLAQEEVGELAKLSNESRRVPNLDLKKTAADAFHTRINAEAQAIRNAYDELPQLRRHVLISGRGQTAVKAATKIHEARSLTQSAAQDLRTFLSEPAYANDPEVAKVLTSISDVPPPNESGGRNNLQRALVALENAHDATAVAAKPKVMVVQAVSNSTVVADPAYRINLPPMQAKPRSPFIKPPTDYNTLYSRRQTLPEILKDPKRAPGGVIIDAKLPADLANRLKRLEVNVSTGAVRVQLDESWQTLAVREDPLLARLAWAFVQDEQIAVIDLRPLDNTEALWLVLEYAKTGLPKSEREELLMQLARLTSVNVNNALRDTPLVSQLIAADQLMFDLLPRNAVAIQGEDSRYGLRLDQLRSAFQADAREQLNRPNWQDVLFNKSLLSVSQIDCKAGPKLVLSPKFSFFLFGVTADGLDAIRLNKSEHWFASHEHDLKLLEQLRPLSEFATLVTLFRGANDRKIPHNLDDLIAVPLPESMAPRFIIRRDRDGEKWQEMKKSLSGRE
jgi:hypothetical protein